MRAFPIIPIWLMIIISITLIIIVWKYNKRNIVELSIIGLMFLINLRIMVPSGEAQIISNNLDVLFVIDNTISMNAEDYDGANTRLSGVKETCKNIIEKLNGARFSIITFNNSAKIATPYTKDVNLTIEAIDIIVPLSEYYARGSSLNTPHDAMLTSLESSKKMGDRTRIVFFISDGEITDESSLNSFKDISKYVDGGSVLGYGTDKGGYMKTLGSYSMDEYIIDYSGYNYTRAISKIDEDNLKSIAKDLGLDYIHMEKQGDIDYKLKEIEKLKSNGMESSDKRVYEDTYYILVVPLLVLLVIEFNDFRRVYI